MTKYKLLLRWAGGGAHLLSYDLVEPLAMELHMVNVDGSGLRRITALGGSNWAPFYLTDNRHVLFSTNFNSSSHFGAFDLYKVADDGTDVQRVRTVP